METNYSKHAAVWDWDGFDRSEEFDFWYKMSVTYGKNVISAMGAIGQAGAYMVGKGYQVTVLDYTKEMIDEGKKRFGNLDSLSFSHANICNFDLAKKDFDFCFVGSGDLHLLGSIKEVNMALCSINRHLRLGGGLGLELWSASDSSYSAPKRRFEARVPKANGPHIWKEGDANYVAATKRMDISQTVYIDNHGIVESFEHSISLQLYDRDVLLQAIHEHGFEMISEYGDYHFEKWNKGSSPWIVELKKVSNHTV